MVSLLAVAVLVIAGRTNKLPVLTNQIISSIIVYNDFDGHSSGDWAIYEWQGVGT